MRNLKTLFGLALSMFSLVVNANNVFNPSVLNEPAPKSRSGGMTYSASSGGVGANEIKVIPVEQTITIKTQEQLRTGTSDWQRGFTSPKNESTWTATRPSD